MNEVKDVKLQKQIIFFMTLYKKPYLQPYKGKSTRHTCPSCKTKSSFTRYLDGNTGQPIHPTVGKCNREIKCGYHYTPRQYFSDHPELKNNQAKSQLPNNRSPLKIESSQANPQHSSTQGPAKYKNSTPTQKPVTGPAQHTSMQTALTQH